MKIEYGAKWSKFEEDKLNKPGTMVWVDDEVEGLLIGDINTNGGMCDCCSDVRYGTIVRAYENLHS